jgi:hypothetical protein
MKIPSRILGLLALATPLIVGCGGDEPEPSKTEQDITSTQTTPAEDAPTKNDERAPTQDDALPMSAPQPEETKEASPRVPPTSDVPVSPFLGPPGGSTSQEPCPACGMG